MSVGKSGMQHNLVSHHIELATHQQNLAIEVVCSTNSDLRIGMSGDQDIQKILCLMKKTEFSMWEYVEIDTRKTYNFRSWTYS